MDLFMKILGALISLALITFGALYILFPSRAVRWLQRLKYKETGTVGKREKIVSIVFGSILALIGIYYLVIVILSIIYPA